MSTHVVCWWHASIWVPGVIWLVVREQGLLCWVQVVRLSVSGMPVGGGWGCQERFTVETLHSCSQGQPFINCDEILFIALPQFIFLVSCPFSHIIILMPLHKQIYYCTHLINSSLYENICPLRAAWLVKALTHGGPFFLPSHHPYHLTHLSQALSFNGLLIN